MAKGRSRHAAALLLWARLVIYPPKGHRQLPKRDRARLGSASVFEILEINPRAKNRGCRKLDGIRPEIFETGFFPVFGLFSGNTSDSLDE